MSPLSLEALHEQVQLHDEKHEDAHRRLRLDYRDLDERVVKLESGHATSAAQLTAMSDRTIDVAKLRFTPSVVISALVLALSVASGIWLSTGGLRSDVRDILTRMDAQAKTDDANRKLSDERLAALRDAVAAMQRRQELQQYEIQGLKETLLKQGSGGR
jgi:hypothetical protein